MKTAPRKPNIDRTRHIPYSRSAERILLKRLREKYGDAEGLRIFENAVGIFEDMCRSDMPFIGGRKSPLGAFAYDSIMCAVCWEAEPEKPTIREFSDTVLEVSFGKRGRTQLPAWFNGDNRAIMALLAFAYKLWAKTVHKRFLAGEFGGYWDAQVNVSPTPEGVQVVTFGCPIYEVLKKRGLERLMPAMCNPDYENFAVKNLVLIRPKLVGNGDAVCDQRIVGKHSALAKACPAYVNDRGFLINDIPEDYAFHPPDAQKAAGEQVQE